MAARFLFVAQTGNRRMAAPSAVWLAWLCGGTAVAAWCSTRGQMANWAWMWGLVAVLLAAHKGLALASASGLARLSRWRLLGFVMAWPGLNLSPFLRSARAEPCAVRRLEPWRLAVWAVVNMTVGVGLLWGPAWYGGPALPVAAHTWRGLIGMSLIAHFGLFQLLTACWRAAGVDVPKMWDFPLLAASLADFWSRAWNRAFHEWVRDQVCRPVRDHASPTAALAAGFLYSGLVHELVLSLPAGGGYGLPTAYFVLQGLGIWLQRRVAWLSRPGVSRAWTLVVVAGPLGLAFHEPFRNQVVLPLMAAIGATS
jgi:hypothetical protein